MIDDVAKEHLHRALRVAGAAVVGKLDGLAEYDLRRPLTVTGTNLLGLVKHLTVTEAWYFGVTFRRPFPGRPPWRAPGSDEGDDELTAYVTYKLELDDMWATDGESRAGIVDGYRLVCEHSDDTIDALAIDAPGHVAWWPRPDVVLFHILVHVVTETNRHAGHADILREQLDGAVGTEPGSAGLHTRDDAFWAQHRERVEQAARAAASDDRSGPLEDRAGPGGVREDPAVE